MLAIPAKRTDRQLVSFLTDDEVDALLGAPDRGTWVGRRDHALLLVAIQTGLRVSELTALACSDVELGAGAHLRCRGKGRKERITPLTTEVCGVLRVWLAERHGAPADAVFPSRRGGPLSSDAVAMLVTRHVRTAGEKCPSLLTKTVTPHVMRHTCAMRLLAVGVDTSVIALWLATKAWRPPRSTCTLISPSKNGPSRALRPPALPPVAIGRPTPSSPSSRACDYADFNSTKPLPHNDSWRQVGIIRCSA